MDTRAIETPKPNLNDFINLMEEKGFQPYNILTLAQALESGIGPEELQLDLTLSPTNKIENKHRRLALKLAENIIIEAPLHKGLIDEEIAQTFIQAGLSENNILALAKLLDPEAFLSYQASVEIGIQEIKALSTALSSGACPKGLMLDLSHTNLEFKSVQALSQALQSGHCPDDLHLILRDNDIQAEGAIILAEALASGHCPPGLRLDLTDNYFGPSYKAIANALISNHCPQRLWLALDFNHYSVLSINNALKNGHWSQGLQLYFELETDHPITKLAHNTGMYEMLMGKLNEINKLLWRQNEIRHAGLSCVTLRSNLAQRNFPEVLENIIYQFTLPCVLDSKEEKNFLTKVKSIYHGSSFFDNARKTMNSKKHESNSQTQSIKLFNNEAKHGYSSNNFRSDRK